MASEKTKIKNPKIAVSLKNISKTFKVRENQATTIRGRFARIFSSSNRIRKVEALKDINLEIKQGEIFGIIGRNGSGKSTLLNIIMQSIRPNKGGEIITNGKLMRLSLGMGIDPNLSARDNIYLNGSVIGLSFKKIGNIFNEVLEFAGLEEFVDTPVKYYSKGMRQRLLFSIAMHAESDIFLLDEFFGGTGDVDFKKKSDMAFKQRILEGRTIIIVSHSMQIIKKYCNEAIWLDKGMIQARGNTKEIVKAYKASFPKKGKKKLKDKNFRKKKKANV